MNYDNIHLQHREALIKEHASFLTNKALLEFGVFQGTSMSMWYDLYTKHNIPIDFVGFDSFKGLPKETEDKNTIWTEGMFNAYGDINARLHKPNIRLVQGFYDQSLNQEAAELLKGIKAGLIHIDCDTYSSTKTVWEWLIKYDILAKNAIIVYDDWGAYLEARCNEYDVGEAKAHQEIENKYNLNFIDLGRYVVDPNFYIVKIYQICN